MNLYDVIANANAPLSALREQMEIAILDRKQKRFEYFLSRYAQHPTVGPVDEQIWRERWTEGLKGSAQSV